MYINHSVFHLQLLKGEVNRCRVTSLNKTIVMESHEDMDILVEKLCSMSTEDLQKLLIDILLQVDYNKYLTMVSYKQP